MTIKFECGNCGKQLSTSDDKAGKRGKCPDCGEPVTVPQPEAEYEEYEEENPFDFDFPAAAPPRTTSRGGRPQTCPMCGTRAPAGASNCPNCGEELRKTGRSGGSGAEGFSTGNKINVGQVFSTAWNRFMQQPGAAIGGLVVVMLSMFVIGFLGGFTATFLIVALRGSFGLMILSLVLLYLGVYVAAIWLQLGLTRFFISLARANPSDFGLIFSGGKYLLRAILCGLLIGLIVLVAYIAIGFIAMLSGMIGGLTGVVVAVAVGAVLFVYVMLSFLWAFHILVDIDSRDVSSVFLSRDLMAGNYLSVFVILFVSGLIPAVPYVIAMAGMLQFGTLMLLAFVFLILVNLFFVVPLLNMIMAVTYDHLSGGMHRRPGDAY